VHRRFGWCRVGAFVAVIVLVAASACSTSDDQPGTVGSTIEAPSSVEPGPLVVSAGDAGIEVGVAVDADRLRTDPDYRTTVATHFSSITPENAMKWTVTRPGPGVWDWTDADVVVDFAEQEGLDVRGHTLVWGQGAGNGLPDWMEQLDDPAAFRAAYEEGIREEVGRYAGRVDRWDVVNEALNYVGPGLVDNEYLQRLGPDYIADAFRLAHEVDPEAELWLNDFSTEIQPEKAASLVELVTSLVDDGVPIDGVGFQTHLNVDLPIAAGAIAGPMQQIRDLGLEVAITELDVPIGPTRSEADQLALYDQAVDECLRADCSEITVWGLVDGDSWLDSPSIRELNAVFDAWAIPSRPLLFDDDFTPKPTYQAVVDALDRRHR
jgi:endo-1,4-beta-xylanase